MTFVVTEEIYNEVESGNQLFHFLTSVLISDLSFLISPSDLSLHSTSFYHQKLKLQDN